eukprot:Plantae.Rhodophyta-Hildenbrandia_rubra.ctg19873.p1 GENE.Plantae.Rhodophyta-Hildenbrandia_rubra.ctg19873~~Plantae.Rhodophyta-Hildenbrandia_rubra.ctg19873.p1  ORF type:complete len:692 (-),score=97.12 Plantae.Rhodophyta-Hildenbrandia_rubra.ctg19873:469-2544(-)
MKVAPNRLSLLLISAIALVIFASLLRVGTVVSEKSTILSTFKGTCTSESRLRKSRKEANGKLVLVTGVAGFIGSHVAKQCLSLNMTVIGIDDLTGGFRSNLPDNPNFKFVKLDVRDAEKLDTLLSAYKFHAVYHLAAYAAEGMSHFIRSYNYKTNLVASVQLLNSAVKSGVKTFVFTSSIAVYGTGRTPLSEDMTVNPEDPYGISKYAMELDLKAAKVMFGINYVIFRPHNVYGPGQNVHDRYRNVVGIFFNQLLRGLPMTIFGNGKQTRAFSYIDGVALPIALAPFVKAAINQIINVGGDQPYEVRELAKTAGMVWDGTRRSKIKYLDARHEVMHAQADHSKLRCLFGSAAHDGIKLEDGLKRTVTWLKARGANMTAPIKFSEVEVVKNMPPSWKTKGLQEKSKIAMSEQDMNAPDVSLDELVARNATGFGGSGQGDVPSDTLVLIPAAGVWNATEKMLISLANMRDKFDVLFADQGKEGITSEMLEGVIGPRVIRIDATRGLTRAWNDGYAYFKENKQYNYFVISNNDILFPDGAINKLRNALRSGYGVACPVSTRRGAGHMKILQGIEHVFNMTSRESILRVNNPLNYAWTQASLSRFFELRGSKVPRVVPFPGPEFNGFLFSLTRKAAKTLEVKTGQLFSPTLFNVHQERDISRRIAEWKVKVALVRDTFAFHYKGSTLKKSMRKRL